MRRNSYTEDENRFFSKDFRKSLINLRVVKTLNHIDRFGLTESPNFQEEFGGFCGRGAETFRGNFLSL